MRLGAFLPIGIFVLVALGVSVRLLLLWRRTRALPELSIGLGLSLMAFVGMPLCAIGRLPGQVESLLGRAAFASGMTANAVGVALLYVFTWSVFRRGDPRAAAVVPLVAGVLAGMVVAYVRSSIVGGELDVVVARLRGLNLVLVLLVAGAFGWTSVEAGRYFAVLRRRARLGLTDPVVAERFLLWSVSGAVTALLCVGIAGCVASGMVVLRHALPLSGIALAGVVMSGAWTLTFFAPDWYRASVVRRWQRA